MFKRLFGIVLGLIIVGYFINIIFIPETMISDPSPQGRLVKFIAILIVVVVGLAIVLPKENNNG